MTASVFQPVRDAYLAWQRTQPQLFIDFTSLPGGATDGGAEHTLTPLGTRPASRQTLINTTAPDGASPDETRAVGGR